jgi:hypothetical protein
VKEISYTNCCSEILSATKRAGWPAPGHHLSDSRRRAPSETALLARGVREAGDAERQNIFVSHPVKTKHVNGNGLAGLRQIGSPRVYSLGEQ